MTPPPTRPIRLNLAQCLRNRFDAQFDLRVPAKMLFSLQRGLFLWTPLTLLASIGFALLLRSRRDRRPYLWGLAVSALCLSTTARSYTCALSSASAPRDARSSASCRSSWVKATPG